MRSFACSPITSDADRRKRVPSTGMMQDDVTTVVAELTGRTVTACMSDSNAEANMVIEVFVLDRPLPEADDGSLPPASANGGGPV